MRILYVIHDFLPRHAAGSQVYAHDLARAVADRGHDVAFFTSESRPGEAPGTLLRRETSGMPVAEIAQWHEGRRLADSFSGEPMERRFSEELARFAPDVVHYHHLLHLSLRFPALVAQGVPQVFTLHDYWLTCPRGGQRLDWAGAICESVDLEKCGRCMANFYADVSLPGRLAERAEARLMPRRASPFGGELAKVARLAVRSAPKALGLPFKYDPVACAEDLKLRQRLVREVFERIDRFIAPSAFLGERMREAGLPAEKLLVSDYGFSKMAAPPRTARGAGPLKIGYVGTLVPHKGTHVLIGALEKLKGVNVELHLFGDPAAFPSYTRRLQSRARGLPVKFHGPFAPEDRARIYARLDALVLPSIWWENSPLTLHEAQAAGVPAIVPRLGAMPELVREGVDGLFYTENNVEDLSRVLRRLAEERGLLESFAPGAARIKPIENDADWTLSLYEALR